MPLATSVLSSLLLAQSLPTVFDANADYTDGRLAIEVVTSEPIAAENVRGKLTADAFVVYVQGAVVERNRRVFARPDGRNVNAYPRAEYSKFEVPFDPDQSCSGAIDIEVQENRVRASVACSPRPAGVAGQTVRQAAGDATSPAAEITRPEPIAARAAFAKPPSKPKAAEPAPLPAPAPVAAAAPSPVAAAAPAPVSPPPGPARSATALDARTRSGGLTGTGPVVAAVLMAALAIFLLWRRRRQHGIGLIQILESASLGPKRSLVVAQIGGQKLILGASEAGITLLSPLAAGLIQTGSDDPTLVNQAEPGAPVESEKGILARLFSRRREETYVPEEEEGPSTMAEDFRDLLEENLEDDDLRRRLQAGVGGRTR